MVEIIVEKERERRTIQVHGHAGESIVCAGVSAIAFALLGTLRNLNHCALQTSIDAGELMIQTTTPTAECDTCIKMALIGWLQIEKAHPDDVHCTQNYF